MSARCRLCQKRPIARDTGWCADCLDAEDRRRAALAAGRRRCRICGVAINGRADRQTCGQTCKKRLQRIAKRDKSARSGAPAAASKLSPLSPVSIGGFDARYGGSSGYAEVLRGVA